MSSFENASVMGMTRVRFSLRFNNYARLEILDVICSSFSSQRRVSISFNFVFWD